MHFRHDLKKMESSIQGTIRTDLDDRLRRKALEVRVTEGSILLMDGDSEIRRVALSDVAEARVKTGIGVDRLEIETVDGKKLDFAFFTKERSDAFRSFAAWIIHARDGGAATFRESESKTKPSGRRGTVLWLVGFMRPHRNQLIAGTLLSVAIAGLNLVPPYMLKILVDSVLVSGGHRSLFLELTFFLLLSYGAASLLQALQTFRLNSTGQAIVNELRARLFSHVINHASRYIDRISTGRILSRLTTDVGNTQWLMVWGLPSVTVNLLTLLGIGIILFTMDASLALFVLVPVPVIILMLIRYRSRSHRLYHKNWRRNADVVARFSDVIPNYAVVKTFAREQTETEEFNSLLSRLYDSQRSVISMNSMYWPTITLLTALATVAIWWVGGNQVIAGHIQLGIIIAFIAYLTLFYQPINNLSNIFPFIQQAITSGERIREILETQPDIVSPALPESPSNFSSLEIKDVSFGYEKYTEVIHGFSLSARAGERIAIAGKSGSGKSTIAKLILRFYDADSGSISIGGVDVRKLSLQELRSRVGYVPQETVLFDASVAYNIKYGRVGEGELWEVIGAAMAAGIHDEIMQLPLAYDTNLGERGNFLSGGQKQRISIARAMYKEPEIVIFDEATSNLDAYNQKMIYRAIKRLSHDRTSIFITHNISEIMDSDRVIVMEGGRKVEEGPPVELMRAGSILHSMFGEELSNYDADGKEDSRVTLEDFISPLLPHGGIVIGGNGNSSSVNVLSPERMYDVVPRLPFPLSSPSFVLFYVQDRPVLMAQDFRRMCSGDMEALDLAIRANNMKTSVRSVERIQLTGEELRWYLKTEDGASIVVHTRGRRNVMQGQSGIVLVDIYDNIYELNYGALDRRSMKLISQIL